MILTRGKKQTITVKMIKIHEEITIRYEASHTNKRREVNGIPNDTGKCMITPDRGKSQKRKERIYYVFKLLKCY